MPLDLTSESNEEQRTGIKNKKLEERKRPLSKRKTKWKSSNPGVFVKKKGDTCERRVSKGIHGKWGAAQDGTEQRGEYIQEFEFSVLLRGL